MTRRIFLVSTFGICLLSIALLSFAETAIEPMKTTLTSEKIIGRMIETYASCKTYQDSGFVKTTFIQTDDEMIVEKPFTTAFVRPDQFRYEFKEIMALPNKPKRYIIWRKGDEVLTWWDVKPGIEKPGSLSLAIAGATGVSDGSAHHIPALLLPYQVSGRKLSGITEAKRISDSRLNNVNCFRIEGKLADIPVVLWIDSTTFLVRRIDERHEFLNFRTETTTTYHPIINSEITNKLLDFDPPARK